MMEEKRSLLITKIEKEEHSGILCTILEHGIPVEFRIQPKEQPSLVGNIYIGRVKNIAPQIGAAFVEIESGILCYYSLEENSEHYLVNRRHKDTHKALVEGDELVVQVNRDALKSKAPSVTSNLNFAGRYLVVTSQNHRLGISNKLSEEERQYLKSCLSPLYDDSYGLIARTNAVEAEEEALQQELVRLRSQYQSVLNKAATRTCFSRLYSQAPAYIQMLRDFSGGMPDQIITDEISIYDEISDYLKEYQPPVLPTLSLYQDKYLPLSKQYGIEKTLEEAMKEKVWLKSGGYLVIQPTEALTVIDVNTGKCESGKQKQRTFWKINREAAIESAKQIRLRNLSGIIIVDFIDMTSEDDRSALMELFRIELKKDPVKTILVDMTKLNLVEITRKKIHKSLREQFENL